MSFCSRCRLVLWVQLLLLLLLCVATTAFQFATTKNTRSVLFVPGVLETGHYGFPRVHNRYAKKQQQQQSMAVGVRGKDTTTTTNLAVLSVWMERVKRILVGMVWSWRKAIRSVVEKYTVYVLECENGKYYVGSTSHKRKRLEQHMMARGGSVWTRTHKPIRVAKQYTRIPDAYYLGLEAKVTAEYMIQFGVNNVRGAMFAQPREYTLDDLEALTGFLGHYNELSYKEISAELEKTLPPSTKTKTLPTKNNLKRKRAKKKRRKNDICNLCGQRGHWAAECPSE